MRRKGCNIIALSPSTTSSFLLTNCSCIVERCSSRRKRHDLFNTLVDRHYYSERHALLGNDSLVRFTEFRQYLESLQYRNQQMKLNRSSIAADMLKERTVSSGTDFRKLMQADFILFLRAELMRHDHYNDWWPETLVYLLPNQRAFEIFERARSKRYFERLRPFLGNATKTELDQLIIKYDSTPQDLPRLGWSRLDLRRLTGLQNLCTEP